MRQTYTIRSALSGPYRRTPKAPAKTKLLAIGALLVAAYWIGWK